MSVPAAGAEQQQPAGADAFEAILEAERAALQTNGLWSAGSGLAEMLYSYSQHLESPLGSGLSPARSDAGVDFSRLEVTAGTEGSTAGTASDSNMTPGSNTAEMRDLLLQLEGLQRVAWGATLSVNLVNMTTDSFMTILRSQ